MAKHRFAALAAGALLSVVLAQAALAGPAVATRWQVANIDQQECLKRAEAAITGTGFGRLERTEQSRYGTRDKYTAAVRCVTSNGIVFMIVSGPDRKLADAMSGVLFKNYTEPK
jgi:hypothetical protein